MIAPSTIVIWITVTYIENLTWEMHPIWNAHMTLRDPPHLEYTYDQFERSTSFGIHIWPIWEIHLIWKTHMTNLRDPPHLGYTYDWFERCALFEDQISHQLRNISVTWCQIGHIFSGNLGAKLHGSATKYQMIWIYRYIYLYRNRRVMCTFSVVGHVLLLRTLDEL